MNIFKLIGFLIAIFSSNIASAQTMNDLKNQLDYLSARDVILSQNLANTDTPGYKPKDLNNSKSTSSIGLVVTNPGHIQINTDTKYDVVPGQIFEIKPDGNAVTIEQELMKKNENAIRFNEASNLYNKTKQLMKTAISGGN